VDTCCIDKTSSAELSEAINSMYQWYWNAELCFALLADFDGTAGLEIALPKCRWFTRGWCLQELIAPKRVELYDNKWNCIGVKADMATLLSNITQIDEQVLFERSRFRAVPAGRRMSWAANRTTTRQEDLAYCLLGLFDVNMPMLYGEGPKAFIRLQLEIIKTSSDLSLFAFSSQKSDDARWNSASNLSGPYSGVFATSPKDFVGCGNVVDNGTNIYWNDTFALTNRGLHLPRAKLQVDFQHQCYILPLKCRVSKSTPAQISLRKVGPGLFAKINGNGPRETDGANEKDQVASTEVHAEIEEAYIVANISPSTQPQLESSSEYAVRVSCQAYHLFKALQIFKRVPSSDRWDSARMQFLTKGNRWVQGFWKLFPNLAKPIASTPSVLMKESSPCILLCGVEYWEDMSHPQAWVRLCSLEEWRNLEQKFGTSVTQGNDANSPLNTGKTADQITINAASANPVTISATIVLEDSVESPYFRLELEFNRYLENKNNKG
jgi:hypothetical protein